ncbi:MAG: hypothetical protein CLLPBCKN_001697 [Chroococcidiopsis cubana SAG 39.79]|nr:hypothetical protein [Chroococcidiopsis cubana SAG 39.79]
MTCDFSLVPLKATALLEISRYSKYFINLIRKTLHNNKSIFGYSVIPFSRKLINFYKYQYITNWLFCNLDIYGYIFDSFRKLSDRYNHYNERVAS